MADEAILRIVLDDGGTPAPASGAPVSTGAAGGGGTPTPPPPPPPLPPPPPPRLQPPPPPPPPSTHNLQSKAAADPAALNALGDDTSAKPKPAVAPGNPKEDPEWLKSLITPKRGATPLDDSNPHVLIEGQSGSGKSMATRHIAMQRMAKGEEVHVADTHTPQSWGGAKQVFQGQSAGTDAAKFMIDTLKERIKQQSEATLKGEKIDFKPITIVLSDFARLMRETPQMQDALKSLLTEGRKFRIGILADTTALTGAASGIKGINDVRNNFGQRAQFYAPTDKNDPSTRSVRIGGTGGDSFSVPHLSDYKDKYDPSLVKPATETDTNVPVGAAAAARLQLEKEKYKAEVQAEYEKLKPPEIPEPIVAKVKSGFDKATDVINVLRGTIGGFFGHAVGVALDIATTIKESRDKANAAKTMIPVAKFAPDAPLATLASENNQASIRYGTKNAARLGDGAAAGAWRENKEQQNAPQAIPIDAAKPVEAVSSVTEKLVMLAPAIAATTIAFSAITGMMDKAVQRYGDYSPEVAQAQAMAEFRQTMNDMRRAQEHGSELARYVEAQTQMQEKFEELKMKLLMKIAPIIEAIFDILGGAMETVSDLPSVAMSIATPLGAIASSINEVVSAQRDEVDKEKDPTSVLFDDRRNKGVRVPES